MNDFIILGTDTDAGKTTFALIWLARFSDHYAYWKPVETGPSDTARVTELAPATLVHLPMLRFETPVAPSLAARMENHAIPSADDIAQRAATVRERSLTAAARMNRSLVIETFGSPFSPLNEKELQLDLVRRLAMKSVLVSSPSLGAIGRTLQCLTALRSNGVEPLAVILMGSCDAFAEEEIRKHSGLPIIALEPPSEWTAIGLGEAAARQAAELDRLHAVLALVSRPSSLSPSLVWHPYTPLLGAPEPLPCVGACDEFLELADGRRVIDAISSWWTILHGHRHRPLMDTLADASRRIDHVLFAGVTHPWAVELAELLLGTMPWVGGRVFYSDNGSTAVEVALKLAYQFWRHHGETGRTRFVGFEHGYHGDTFGAMAVSRDPLFFGAFEPLLFGADIVPLDPDRLDAHLQRHAQETAAVILEPLVQGAGGMRMHTAKTLRQIAEVTRRHGVLFIADEVMTGGGRTGTLWAHQAAGIVPDLVCAAKTLAGGILPLAATLIAPKIVDAFRSADRSRTFFHGHSFTANPLACAIAVRNMRELLASPPTAPRLFERFWQQALAPLRAWTGIKDVRVRGSIAAIELDAAGGYLADVGARMRQTCLDLDVMLRPLGPVLYALPPYCTSEASLERIVEAMRRAIGG
ncbi:MAG TPA: adenosylmethionine--8-amino-7-oxononanoate transaminase [Gemmataceae bacterium]|nr:adenosylmethionine--8-amino-7-oxononanoate transaminase [Gemmataceae bacterium]